MESDSTQSLFNQLLAVFILLVAAALYIVLPKVKNIELWLLNEDVFSDPVNPNKKTRFPSIFAAPTLDLSIIVPSYNEEERLPIMLSEALEFLTSKNAARAPRARNDAQFTWEIIVVDDGSRDTTSQVALEVAKRETSERVRVLTLQKNRGKGGAVKRGMMCARGKMLLMADADGATKISDLDRLISEADKIKKDEKFIAVGSRSHLQAGVVAKRSFFRNILMRGFHVLVSILGVRGVADTQCGFKLFSRQAAQLVFPNQHIERWAFDVELLFLAQKMKIPIKEVPVNWREVPGSKLSAIEASIEMARDLARIRLAYILGIWKFNPKPQLSDKQ